MSCGVVIAHNLESHNLEPHNLKPYNLEQLDRILDCPLEVQYSMFMECPVEYLDKFQHKCFQQSWIWKDKFKKELSQYSELLITNHLLTVTYDSNLVNVWDATRLLCYMKYDNNVQRICTTYSTNLINMCYSMVTKDCNQKIKYLKSLFLPIVRDSIIFSKDLIIFSFQSKNKVTIRLIANYRDMLVIDIIGARSQRDVDVSINSAHHTLKVISEFQQY